MHHQCGEKPECDSETKTVTQGRGPIVLAKGKNLINYVLGSHMNKEVAAARRTHVAPLQEG